MAWYKDNTGGWVEISYEELRKKYPDREDRLWAVKELGITCTEPEEVYRNRIKPKK